MDPSEQRLNPFPWYAAMLASRPVAHDTLNQSTMNSFAPVEVCERCGSALSAT